jgi:hypothetical protein
MPDHSPSPRLPTDERAGAEDFLSASAGGGHEMENRVKQTSRPIRLPLMAGLVLGAGMAGAWLGALEPDPAMPTAHLEVTGTPGQAFRGVIQAGGQARDVGGTVPATYPLGSGRFMVRLWMAGGAGRLTNTVYEHAVPRAGVESDLPHERLSFERSARGRLGISTLPSNAVLSLERRP